MKNAYVKILVWIECISRFAEKTPGQTFAPGEKQKVGSKRRTEKINVKRVKQISLDILVDEKIDEEYLA